MSETFKGGLDLKFVTSSEFELLDHVAPEEQAPIIARNALRLLKMGWPSESWTKLLTWPVFKAVFVHRDPALLKELRLAFQQGFEILFTQVQGTKLNKNQSEQVQLYLSNCLSLLPYSDLTPYESIKIPQHIKGEWVLVEYHITPIELTPTTGIRSCFIQDHDRVFSYGLEPISNQDAQSHLIFMGTTYPAGQGFVPQIETDLKGFETVGKSLYISGIERIKEWLVSQKDKVHVCGVSLGGSLGLLLAIHQGQHITRVDALNPAGLHDPWHKSQYDQWDELESKPQVVIQQQANDPVSLLGVWKSGWDILQVKPPEDKKGPNPFCDHFLNYAGFAQTEFTFTDVDQENAKRKSRNFWLYSVGRSIIYYTAIVPYNYVIRPVLYFIAQQWLPITLGLIFLAGIGALTALTLFGTIPLVALVGTLVGCAFGAGAFALNQLLADSPAQGIEGENNQCANLHDPSLPRNHSMDIYNSDNKIEVNLTHKQIHTYYKVIRCLVKGKNFLPDDKPQEHFADGLSKKELLRATLNPENDNVVVSLKKTKAKTVHISHVLTLVDKLGIENEQELKRAVEQKYRQYRIGKHRGV